jgi:hypothetical protein
VRSAGLAELVGGISVFGARYVKEAPYLEPSCLESGYCCLMASPPADRRRPVSRWGDSPVKPLKGDRHEVAKRLAWGEAQALAERNPRSEPPTTLTLKG